MSEGQSQLTALAADLQRVLAKLITVMRRGDPGHGSRPDLTMAQVSILLTLIDSGPIRMTELAARERVRTPTTTVAIRRLEKLSLVKRSRDPSDMRAVLVEVTPEGLVQYRDALEVRRTYLAELLGRLTNDERADLVRALKPLERLTAEAPDG
jgi:DNA-binding MarR family transcriptional regulator